MSSFDGISDGMISEEVVSSMMMASAAREAEIRKRQGHAKLVNELLENLPPDLMIERIKGVLYRNLAILESWQKCEEANAGQDMLAQALFSISTTLGESMKWIAMHNEIDPYAPYGDDTYVIRVQDIVLGIELEEDEEKEFVADPPKRKYDVVERDEDDEL